MIKPIKPSEIKAAKNKNIPDAVIKIFNDFIVKEYDDVSAVVVKDEVLKKITSELNVSRNHVIDNGWLDVEDLYRKAGWKVIYDKPGYNESYDAFYKFTKK